MSREGFIDILRSHFVEEIHAAYLECEHGSDQPVDYEKLGRLLARLMTHAKASGLTAEEFEELTMASLPGLPVQLHKIAA